MLTRSPALHSVTGYVNPRVAAGSGARISTRRRRFASHRGWNGPGPCRIINNYIEAAGENLMFGGADPMIPALVPSDSGPDNVSLRFM